MSAAATTKTKSMGKGKDETKGKAKDGNAKSRRSKTGTSDKQKAANKRNAAKSTGPRTPGGKQKSSFNAVTHGLTARSMLLPGENAAELAARQQHLIDTFQPCHPVELEIVERMAGDIWRADRAERSAGLRLGERLRHEPLEQAAKEQEEAIELGGRLFWKPAFPLPISTRFPVGKITEPECAESPSHPHHPARLRLKLEQTLAGCDWLIDRWNERMYRLDFNGVWLTSDNFHTVRLMGKHAIDMASDLDVVRVFLCGLTLLSAPEPGPEREAFDWKAALIKMLMTFDLENKHGIASSAAKQCEPFARRLAELPLAKLAPRDQRHARSWLNGLIEQEIKRLREIRLYLQAVADADAAEAPGRLAFETGPEGDRQRRYGLSSERLVIKRFGDFLKTRAQIVAGTFTDLSVDSGPLSVVSGPPLSVVGGPPLSVVSGPPLSVVSGPLSVVGGQLDAIGERGAPGEELRVAVDGVVLTRCGSGDIDGLEERSFVERKSTMGDRGCGWEPSELLPTIEEYPSGHETLDASTEYEVGCDDDRFLRNEPILSGVSSPLSVESGKGEGMTEAIAPSEPTAAAGEPLESFEDAQKRIRQRRQEYVRQLNEQSQKEAAAARAVRGARRRQPIAKDHNPADEPEGRPAQTGPKTQNEPAETEMTDLEGLIKAALAEWENPHAPWG